MSINGDGSRRYSSMFFSVSLSFVIGCFGTSVLFFVRDRTCFLFWGLGIPYAVHCIYVLFLSSLCFFLKLYTLFIVHCCTYMKFFLITSVISWGEGLNVSSTKLMENLVCEQVWSRDSGSLLEYSFAECSAAALSGLEDASMQFAATEAVEKLAIFLLQQRVSIFVCFNIIIEMQCFILWESMYSGMKKMLEKRRKTENSSMTTWANMLILFRDCCLLLLLLVTFQPWMLASPCTVLVVLLLFLQIFCFFSLFQFL